MNNNTSATGGFLIPGAASPEILNDQALEDFLRLWIVGITNLKDDLVRPWWEEEPVPRPPSNVTWCAFNVASRKKDWDAFVMHVGDAGMGGLGFGEGEMGGAAYDFVQRTEELQMMCSFYGPYAEAICTRLTMGCSVGQNKEYLFKGGFQLNGTGDPIIIPEKLKGRWIKRVDVKVGLRRAVQSTYPVLDLLSATGSIVTDTGLTIELDVPAPEES